MRAAARLGTDATSDHDRFGQFSPLAMLMLALLAAVGVFLPWAEGVRWSKDGWEYTHGIVTFAAAAEAAIVYALRASGNINRQRYQKFGFLAAFVGFGATAWFYLDVIGSEDPVTILASFCTMPRKAGAAGLYLSMAGFVGQIGVLFIDFDHGVRNVVRSALDSPRTTAVLVGLAAIGTLLMWRDSSCSSGPGWSFNQGLVALVAAIEGGIVGGLRITGHARIRPYAMLGLLCAFVGLGAVVWFHDEFDRGLDPSGYPLVVWWLNAPRTSNGIGESISAASFIGMISVLFWQLWQGRRSNI